MLPPANEKRALCLQEQGVSHPRSPEQLTVAENVVFPTLF